MGQTTKVRSAPRPRLCAPAEFGSARDVVVRWTVRQHPANLLSVVGLAVADRIEAAAREILGHAGETPAAVVVIGYGLGPSNDELRLILGLSDPGSVRLVDRLVAEGLIERRKAHDKRSVALYLTPSGEALREELLRGRLIAIRPLLLTLTEAEQEALASLLHKMLSGLPTTDLDRCDLCRLCDNRECADCPIPANFQSERAGSHAG